MQDAAGKIATWAFESLNGQGLPHSDQLHGIERYRRPGLGRLEIEITMEDPKAFTSAHVQPNLPAATHLGNPGIRLQ